MAERNLDFDTVVNRKGTGCLKYDFAPERGYPEDILPFWVADMDFKTSSYVEDALVEMAHHNIYGYTNTKEDFFNAVAGWMKRHHNWEVKREWHVKTPGVCFAIANAIRAVTKPGEGVIINQPVYYPFASIIRQQSRKLVISDLVKDAEGYYQFDFDDFEKKIIENEVKLFVLCNPQNPVGRVWTKDELTKIGNICKKNGVIVFSDEIHSDFIWKGEHVVFQEIDPEYKDMWMDGEPSYVGENADGLKVSEEYLDLFYLKSQDRFVLNDVEEDISAYYPGKIGYICEYE